MKKLLFGSLLLLGMKSSNAQETILQDPVTATIFSTQKYSGINGSPFLFENWIPGTASIDRGTFKNLQLKIDAYSNVLYFKVGEDAFEFREYIKRFVLMPSPDSTSFMFFKRGLSGPSLKPEQFVRVLAEGRLSLYKSDIKSVSDMSEINAGIIRTFSTNTRYYVEKGGQLQLLRTNRKNDLLELMNDKEKEVGAYIDQKHLSTRKDSDLAAIFKYYNSL